MVKPINESITDHLNGAGVSCFQATSVSPVHDVFTRVPPL
jgi:hypothetical protein